MERAGVLALASLIACHKEPELLGAKFPAGCATEQGAGTSRCMGWIIDRLMMSTSYHAYPDVALSSYVTSIGNRIARAAGDRGQWQFHVLDDPEVQAFASLGHVVYVQRGAIAVLRDEAELAALLAHEIAHVVAEHVEDTIRSDGWGDEHARTRYARDDEIQADELAVKFVAAAGYDPTAVERMLRAVGATAPNAGDATTSTHPAWTERVARVQAMAAHFSSGGRREEAALRAHLERLVIGNDPRRAAIFDHTIVFDRLGLAVDAGAPATIDSDGAISITLGDSAAVQLRVLPAEVAGYFKTDNDIAVESHRAGSSTLVVIAAGERRVELAAAVAAHVRPMRPDERAKIKPVLVDLRSPRALWPATK